MIDKKAIWAERPGEMFLDEIELLQRLASDANAVLEIGTGQGISGLAIASGLPDGARLVTCDIKHKPEARERYERHRLLDKVEMRVIDGFHDFPGGEFDLVFVDGNHYFPYALADIAHAMSVVTIGGWIVGHDYNRRRFHVQQAVHLLLDGNPDYEPGEYPGSCFSFRRVS